MTRRFLLYFLCLSVTLLYCCQDPLEPEDEGGSDPDTEQPVVPEEPVLPPGPVDPDDPSNPENPPVNPPVDPTDPEKPPVNPPVDPTDPENPPVNPPVDPTDPENPPVDPPVDPTDPEEPEKPVDPEEPSYVPQISLFENFTVAGIPEGFQVYNEDKSTELFNNNPGGSWIAFGVGGGATSYCVFKDKNTGKPVVNGASEPVDNWIVTKGVKIDRLHTRLSWDMVAIGFTPPLSGVVEDAYQVYISTAGQQVSDMKATQPVYSTSALKQGAQEWREINLDKYVGQTIYIGFRHCTPIHNSTILRLFNIKVKEYYEREIVMSNVNVKNVYKPNELVEVRATVYNAGLAVRSVTATYTYGAQQVTEEIPVNLGFNETKVIAFSHKLMMNTPGESHTLYVDLAPDLDSRNNRKSALVVCPDKEPAKRVLAEKLTSISCGPCGSIINTLDEAEEKFPDKVIGIAIHTSFPAGDEMECSSYLDWLLEFYDIFVDHVTRTPVCSMNKLEEVGYPSIPNNVMKFYNQMVSPAELSVDVTYDPMSRQITATANTTPAFTSHIGYRGFMRIGFVVTEDGLQNWQKEAHTNPQTGKPYDIHNHTARELIGGTRGFANSIPETVTLGETIKYTIHHTIPAQYGKDKAHPPKPENMSVIAILYNEITGEVLNCARTKVIN